MSETVTRGSAAPPAESPLRVIVAIQHPAHVHFFRHAIDRLEREGHEVFVFAREKDVALDLLEAYDVPYTALAGEPRSPLDLVRVQSKYEFELWRRARRIDPDVLAAIAEPGVAHVGALLDVPSLLFTDTEHATLQNRIAVPFADRVYTPAAFNGDFGAKHVTYEGYHELAYLHPDRFAPDPDRLRRHGVAPEDEYYVIRSIAWDALHDYGKSGLSRRGLREIVSLAAERGDVYVTSEGPLPPELERYRSPVPVDLVHDLLAYADGYVGDSGTMATEAGVLGTPAIRIDPFVNERRCGNFVELEHVYGLVRSTADERVAVAAFRRRLDDPETADRWAERRRMLLSDTIDVTAFVVEQLRALGAATPRRIAA